MVFNACVELPDSNKLIVLIFLNLMPKKIYSNPYNYDLSKDGFLILENLLTTEEIKNIRIILENYFCDDL